MHADQANLGMKKLVEKVRSRARTGEGAENRSLSIIVGTLACPDPDRAQLVGNASSITTLDLSHCKLTKDNAGMSVLLDCREPAHAARGVFQ